VARASVRPCHAPHARSKQIGYNLVSMSALSKLEVTHLLQTDTMVLRNVRCSGACAHRSDEECASATHLVFTYRGVYMRHVGADQAVADANHVLFYNSGEGYQISHPLKGTDASLSLSIADDILRELAPKSLLQDRGITAFRRQHQRIDPRVQVLAALLRHSLERESIEALKAESLVLTLVCRSLGPRTSHEPRATHAVRRLADRVKLLLSSDLSRRWTLAEIAAETGGSAVYLTQVFQRTEGLPLYRYHLRLRLARALDMIGRYDDLSALAADLGFSSHSHFTAAFRQAYGQSPAAFRELANCA
jgi:AraC family transcriptional regulator